MGSGLFITLKPGEEIELKDTKYVIKNHGAISCSLNIYTQESRRQAQKIRYTKEVIMDVKYDSNKRRIPKND